MKYSQAVLVACVGGAALVSAIPIGPESHERRNFHTQDLDATPQGYSASQGSTPHATHTTTGHNLDETSLGYSTSQGSMHTAHDHHTPGHRHHNQQVSSQSLSTGTNDPIHVYSTRKFEPDPNSELSYKKQKRLRNAQKGVERYQDLANSGNREAQKKVKNYQKIINKLSGGQPQASEGQMPPGAPDQPDATQFGTRDFVQDLDARDDFVYDTRAPFDENGMPEDPFPSSTPCPPSSGTNKKSDFRCYFQIKVGSKILTIGSKTLAAKDAKARADRMASLKQTYKLGPHADETAAPGGGSSTGPGGASDALTTRHLDEEAALVARDIFEKLYARYFNEMDELD